MFFPNNKKGFSIRELLMYIGVLVIAGGLLTAIFFTADDRRVTGALCSANSECHSGFCYRDEDGDRFEGTGQRTCRLLASLGTDCFDANANARPGQTDFFATHRGDGSFDYDCNGSTDKRPGFCDTVSGVYFSTQYTRYPLNLRSATCQGTINSKDCGSGSAQYCLFDLDKRSISGEYAYIVERVLYADVGVVIDCLDGRVGDYYFCAGENYVVMSYRVCDCR